MSILAWIVVGGLAGWIASKIMHTDESQGILANIVVGIIGALLGGFLLSLFGGNGVSGFNFYSLLVAVIGSCILLWIVRLVRGGTHRSV